MYCCELENKEEQGEVRRMIVILDAKEYNKKRFNTFIRAVEVDFADEVPEVLKPIVVGCITLQRGEV